MEFLFICLFFPIFFFFCIMAQSLIFYKVVICFNGVAVSSVAMCSASSDSEGHRRCTLSFLQIRNILIISSNTHLSISKCLRQPSLRWQELSHFKVRLDRLKGRSSKRRGRIQHFFCPGFKFAVLYFSG